MYPAHLSEAGDTGPRNGRCPDISAVASEPKTLKPKDLKPPETPNMEAGKYVFGGSGTLP